MRNRNHHLTLVLTAGVLFTACSQHAPEPPAKSTSGTEAAPDSAAASDAASTATAACDTAAARHLAERLGESLKRVSLLAPDSLVRRAMDSAYAPLVTPALLDAWTADPAHAPGKTVSSPWPERIEVESVRAAAGGTCRVEGQVVYVTSAELAHGGAAARQPVTLGIVNVGGGRIGSYQAGARSRDSAAPPPDSAMTAAAAADVIRRYYAAIDAKDFREAYDLWGNGGQASGQTFPEFRAGFAKTANVEVEIGTPGRIDPAAGSRYVDVPVVVRAVTTGGERQRFEGKYSLRRTVVDGSTPEQRHWHIYSADVHRAR
jgi:hypothetical protein